MRPPPWEKVRSGYAAGRTAAEQVRLHGGEAGVAGFTASAITSGMRPSPSPGDAAVLLPGLPVLDVEVSRVRGLLASQPCHGS